MKLKIGMYCYNKTNRKFGIGKIISFQSNNVNVRYKNDIELVNMGNIIASNNILNLIKVGDVIKFKELRTHITNNCNTKFYEEYICDIHDEEELKEFLKEVKGNHIKLLNIMTKESFENNCYILQGDDEK